MASVFGNKPIVVPPYFKLAEIYDHVMNHVNYSGWAHYIHRIFRRSGSNVKSVLEIACGTGNIGIGLINLGYDVIGCDLSFSMLQMARCHARKDGITLPLFVADIRTIHTRKQFDAALCLYDSTNYLLTIDEVCTSLNSVYNCLRPDGLFIFDICTIANSQRNFNGYTCKEKGNGYRFVRKSRFEAKSCLQYNTFTIQFNGNTGSFWEEHIQRIYRVDDILEAIGSSSFQLLGYFDNTSFRKGSEKSERVHLILVK